jgi:1-acyl-sn-glycerol-3-phosphate acyltransferase
MVNKNHKISFLRRNIFFMVWSLFTIGYSPSLLLPRKYLRNAGKLWLVITLWLCRVILNIHYNIIDRHNIISTLAQGDKILVCNHQSLLETLLLSYIIPNYCFVLKKELFNIPIFGWYCRRVGCIGINRNKPTAALKKVIKVMESASGDNYTLIIFPQGTRGTGQHTPIKKGFLKLIEHSKRDVVIASSDAGRCWPKDVSKMHMGVINLNFHQLVKFEDVDERVLLRKLQSL